MSWRRWFNYGKARVDAAGRDVDADVETKQAAIDAAEARLAPVAPAGPAADPSAPTADAAPDAAADDKAKMLAFELAKQNAAAEERLAEIRKSVDGPDGAN